MENAFLAAGMIAVVPVIYLDLNHWYALGAANAGHPERSSHTEILGKLAAQVVSGRLQFPLSAVHYMELTENPRDNQRQEAAAVMATLSRFVTMASVGRIVDGELAKELNERYGRPAFPMKVPKFGRGYRYAFDVTTDPEEEIDNLKEYLVLEGAPQAIRGQIPNYDAYSGRRIADSELDSFNVMLNTLRTDPDIAKRPLDAICARQLCSDILDNFTRARISAGFPKYWPPGLRNAEQLTDFLLALPSRRVAAMIQFHYLKDVQRDWKINDLRDILALSAAIPYCDIVVADNKAWDVTKQRAHLDEEFNTEIFRSLDDLAAHLDL
jgi:hypothetical protein